MITKRYGEVLQGQIWRPVLGTRVAHQGNRREEGTGRPLSSAWLWFFVIGLCSPFCGRRGSLAQCGGGCWGEVFKENSQKEVTDGKAGLSRCWLTRG